MGLFDLFKVASKPAEAQPQKRDKYIVGAVENAGQEAMSVYDNKNITFSGDLTNYDYSSILRDKQTNIVSLYELSDYFVDVDGIYRGIIKGAYVPFSLATPYKLIGANENVKQRYLDYYDRIGLKDRMRSIFLQYFKYGNVYLYLTPEGVLMNLPVHKCRIGNITTSGEPIVEFNAMAIKNELRQTGTPAVKNFIKDDDLNIQLQGFPKEVAEAVNAGKEWVQLDPANTFVLQDLKEDWMKYAVPMVASCLRAFAKKALIQTYENSMLNAGARTFLHVKLGNPKNESEADLPDLQQLRQTESIFRRAIAPANTNPVAVTNNWVEAKFVQADTKDFFKDDKFAGVNAEILSAGGINGILVSGRTEDGSTFGTAQVSMQTAAMRIQAARDNFCEMMNKINYRLNGVLPHAKSENIPVFTFPPVDLANDKAFQDACFKLWQQGVLSNKTLLEVYGYDIEQEVERKKKEESEGITDILAKKLPGDKYVDLTKESGGAGQPGRPPAEDQTQVDQSKSETGAQPKPSNPKGST